jgi:hypothetical protein
LRGRTGGSHGCSAALVWWSRGSALHRFRAAAIDLLATVDIDTYRRTRAALLLAEGRHAEAITELRSVAGTAEELSQDSAPTSRRQG